MIPSLVGMMKQDKWKKNERFKKSAEIASSDTLEKRG